MDNKSPDAFRTISEVADWLGVPAHVLRFWESRFGQVKPVKRAGGRRYYRPSDMELLGGIRKLLHEDGLTIRGVQKLLRENGVKYVAAMSPPIDQSADLKDVSASSEAPREVEAAAHDSRSDHDAPAERETFAERDASGDRDTLADRAAPIFDTDAEDAVEITQTPEATQDQPREPAASPTAHTPHEPDTGAPDDRDSAPQIDAQIDAETAATADRVDTADTGATDHEDVEPEDTLAASPPFDSPEAIDFYAHEAQPETVEHAAPSREPSVSETVSPEQEPETEAPRAEGRDASHGSSEPGMDREVAAQADAPEAHPVAASKSAPSMAGPEIDATNPEPPEQTPEHAPDQAPDQAKLAADEDVPKAPAPTEPPLAEDDQAEDGQAEEDATAAESSNAVSSGSESGDSDAPAPRDTDDTPPAPPPEPAIVPEPAVATAPDIVMPLVGADPEDDDVIPTAPAVAAALRRQRFRAIVEPRDADLDPAPFKAQLDRLQALSGRLGAAPDRRRSF